MNVYFSCSLTGGRQDESVYGSIVDYLLENGHEVPTAHLARPEVMDLERVVDANEIFQRDVDWIDNCQAVVAEVSTPSHGVGYEIAYALSQGKPVLCLYRHDRPVSKMITGNDSKGIQVEAYGDSEQAQEIIEGFLGSL